MAGLSCRYYVLAHCLLLLVLPCALAESSRVLRHGVESSFVAAYPKQNGMIYAHAIPMHIYEGLGYRFEPVVRPAKRLGLSLINGEIDIMLNTKVEMAAFKGRYVVSRFPLIIAPFLIYYDSQKDWRPSWPPTGDFQLKSGKSVQSSLLLKGLFGLNISQSRSFDTGVKMVNMGRADYYVENSAAFGSVTPGLLQDKTPRFSIEVLYTWNIFAFFRDDQDGRALLAKFDQGMTQILLNKNYANIYFSRVPVFTSAQSVEDTVNFINANNPGVNFARQPCEICKHLPKASPVAK